MTNPADEAATTAPDDLQQLTFLCVPEVIRELEMWAARVLHKPLRECILWEVMSLYPAMMRHHDPKGWREQQQAEDEYTLVMHDLEMETMQPRERLANLDLLDPDARAALDEVAMAVYGKDCDTLSYDELAALRPYIDEELNRRAGEEDDTEDTQDG